MPPSRKPASSITSESGLAVVSPMLPISSLRSNPVRMHAGNPSSARQGSVLVEFAVLIALVFYMLLAVTIEFGRMMYCAQTIQQTADVFAHELSRHAAARSAGAHGHTG